MSAKVSPFTNRKPFLQSLQSCDVKLAQDVIKDLNSSQRQESKKLTLQKVLMRLNAANKQSSKKLLDNKFGSTGMVSPSATF